MGLQAKPGYLSTEFYMTMLVHVLTILVQADVLGKDTPWAKLVSLALSALVQLGYTASRGAVKSAHATAGAAITASAITAVTPILAPSLAVKTTSTPLAPVLAPSLEVKTTSTLLAPVLALILIALTASSGCGWWQSKGKAEVTAAAKCMEGDLLNQWQTLLAQIATGNIAVVATVGTDVLNCALAAAQAQAAPVGSSVATAKQSVHSVAVAVIKAELTKRGTKS